MRELWDIVDANGNKTGKTICRDDPMLPGEHHLAVSVWIKNSNGEFLISRRDFSKRNAPGMWETSGGCALSGETGFQTVLREIREELGLQLNPACGRIFKSYTWPRSNGNGSSYVEVWIFQCDSDIGDVILQPGETCDAMWASADKIREMIRNGEFIPFDYIEDLFASV